MVTTSPRMGGYHLGVEDIIDEEPFDVPKSPFSAFTSSERYAIPSTSKDEADMGTVHKPQSDGEPRFEDREDNSMPRHTRTCLDANEDQRDDTEFEDEQSIHWSASDLDGSVYTNSHRSTRKVYLDEERYEVKEERTTTACENQEEESDIREGFEETTDHVITLMKQSILAEITEEVERDQTSVQEECQEKTESEDTDEGIPQTDVGVPQTEQSSPGAPDVAVRTNRSIDEKISDPRTPRIVDSRTPKAVQSPAISITARTRNTRTFRQFQRDAVHPDYYTNFVEPHVSTNALANDTSDESALGTNSSVLTGDLQAGTKLGGCSILPCQPYQQKEPEADAIVAVNSKEDEDMLDRFFENIESQVCKNGEARKPTPEEEEGMIRVFNPLVNRLEQCDPVFEQIEEVACPEDSPEDSLEDKNKDEKDETSTTCGGTFNEKMLKTPVAFAVELFDRWFDDKEKQTAKSEGPEGYIASNMNEASTENEDQMQKMKEQWFAAKLNWKLRKSMMEVKENTAKAAEKTTHYMQALVGDCHPEAMASSSSAVTNKDNKEMSVCNKDDELSAFDGSVATGMSLSHSVDESNFLSVMSPSEHSNISSMRGFRSSMMSPSAMSKDESAMSWVSHSDNVMRSPECLSPASQCTETSDSVAHAPMEGSNRIASRVGISSRPLAVISEETAPTESTEENVSARMERKPTVSIKTDNQRQDSSGKRNPQKETPSTPNMRRWAYPSPEKLSFTSAEWMEKWNETVQSVYSVSEKFLDRGTCASVSINLTDSNSFEDDRRQQKKKSERRVKRQSSIAEDEDQSAVMEQEENDVRNAYHNDSYDSDLTGFETAMYTFDSEPTDERPPMLRLQRSRQDSRSCGSNSRSDPMVKANVHDRLFTEVPAGYTLADSIRHAALTSGAAGNRGSKEPRGNKLKRDHSVHGRYPSIHDRYPSIHGRHTSSIHVEPQKQKQEPESAQGLLIRSPRSNETEDTARLTTFSSSSSEEQDNGSKRPMIVSIGASNETSGSRAVECDIVQEDEKTTESFSIGTASFKECRSRAETQADNDDDKGTVFSGNTISTDSFKDCYQDAIPSLPTMNTFTTTESKSSRPPPAAKAIPKTMANATTTTTAGAATAENVLKSMALLSVSAAVLGATQKNERKGISAEQTRLTTLAEKSAGDLSVQLAKDSEEGLPSMEDQDDSIQVVESQELLGNYSIHVVESQGNVDEPLEVQPKEEENDEFDELDELMGVTNDRSQLQTNEDYYESFSIMQNPSDEYRADFEAELLSASKEKEENDERDSIPCEDEVIESTSGVISEAEIVKNLKHAEKDLLSWKKSDESLSLPPKEKPIEQEGISAAISEEEIVENLAKVEKVILAQKKSEQFLSIPPPSTERQIGCTSVAGESIDNIMKELETLQEDPVVEQYLIETKERRQQDFHSNLNPMEDSDHLRDELGSDFLHDEESSDNFTAELANLENLIMGHEERSKLSLLEPEDEFESEDPFLYDEDSLLMSPKEQITSSVKKPMKKKKMKTKSKDENGPLTVEQRRQRRLKQRRKFEKVLLGEDDSSSMSSSTMASVKQPKNDNSERQHSMNYTPLISASFDTIPVIKK